MDYLKHFYCNTITHEQAQLDYLIDLVGVDRVVLSSDCCFDILYWRPPTCCWNIGASWVSSTK